MECIKSQAHTQTIIHIGIDCFYAQVELLSRPHLQNEPVGVKQRNIVVTCNYIARRFGIKKCMLVSEALQVCPNLLLFNGEDMYKYCQASNQIHLFLLSFTNKVEKNGLDEYYMDVSEIVKEYEHKEKYFSEVKGHCIGEFSNICPCSCHVRLSIGSKIAQDIRAKLKNILGFTSSCGISFNKMLAKVSCSVHKPNQQTTLLPNGALNILLKLNEADKIPEVGEKIKKVLDSINVRTVKDLQEVDFKRLKQVLKSKETAGKLKNVSLGICNYEVKQSGKQDFVNLEDGFQKISVESEIREKFKILLQRLMILAKDDGRTPMTVKVTTRKQDSGRNISYRETKQSPIPTSLFHGSVAGKLSEESSNKLLNIIMGLFCKMINLTKPFHITLLGLGFTKFHEKMNSHFVASYLLKKKDLSVQSLTSFMSNKTSAEVTNDEVPTSSKSGSDSDSEPSPKKTKLDIVLNQKHPSEDVEMCSPSKLRVENLSINGNLEFANDCTASADPNLFKELSRDLPEEIARKWKYTCTKPRQKCDSQQRLIHIYGVKKRKLDIF